ncbi:MAG: glycosyltransferase [Halobacteriota archaeon]
MNILQICPLLAESPRSTVSGVSKAAYSISTELAARGHEVTLCTSAVSAAKKSGHVTSEISEGIKLLRFPYKLSYYTFFVTHGFAPFLRENLREFDIVHLHDMRHFQALVAHRYAVRYTIPYVLQAHGAALPFRRRAASLLFDVTFGRSIVNDAASFIALTSQERGQYRSLGAAEHKIKIVPNGISSSEFTNLPVRGGFRTKHGLSDSDPVILFLGRIHKIKGLDLLLEAFALLHHDLKNAKLVVVGPDTGNLANSLRRRARKLGLGADVLFVGPLYQRDKLEAYVDADVYVLPSRYETFPFTVLEAWACGTPVIVTDRCGISEYVKKAGRVVEFEAVELYKALLSVLGDAPWRAQASKLGQDLVRAEFSWDRIIDQLEALYLELSENNTQKNRSVV